MHNDPSQPSDSFAAKRSMPPCVGFPSRVAEPASAKLRHDVEIENPQPAYPENLLEKCPPGGAILWKR